MSDKSAVQHDSAAHRGAERDTLPTLERGVLQEQLQAALSARSALPERGAGEDEEEGERDTEPSLDAVMLRDAFLAVGNNHGQ